MATSFQRTETRTGDFNTLLQQARSGDPHAVDELAAAMHQYLARVVSWGANPNDGFRSSSDLVQDAFLRAWGKLDQFCGDRSSERGQAKFGAWLRRIARHHCIDLHRRQALQKPSSTSHAARVDAVELSSSVSVINHLNPAGSEPTPSSLACLNESARVVARAIAELDDELDRTIVSLRFREGLRLRQISDELGLQYDQLRYRFHQTMRQLETRLRHHV